MEESIVTAWLHRIGVGEMSQKFFNDGVRDLKQASNVQEKDLISMRIEKTLHNYILLKVEELNNELKSRKSGFDLLHIPESVAMKTIPEIQMFAEEEEEKDLFNKKNDEKRYGISHKDVETTTPLSALIQEKPYVIILCAPIIWPWLPLICLEGKIT